MAIGLLIFIMLLVALDVVAVLYGEDSRDGKDWNRADNTRSR
jgi:hypothetical protein